MLSFFPRAVLDEIWDLIESAVSEGFSFLLFSMYHSGRMVLGGGRVMRLFWVNFHCRVHPNLDNSGARAYCACSRCGHG